MDLILEPGLLAAAHGMMSVTTHSTSGASWRRWMASPEKMPWVAETLSSLTMQVLPSMLPMMPMTSDALCLGRLLWAMATSQPR